jgi:tetratricopeptide (TPR) repeat protein
MQRQWRSTADWRRRSRPRVCAQIALGMILAPLCCFAMQAGAPSSAKSSAAQIEAGISLLQRNELAAAKLRFTTALRADSRSADALTWRGITENQLKQYHEAEQDFTAALAIDPHQIPAHYNLALTLIRLGQPDRAIDQLRQVVKARPGVLEPEYNLAILLEQKHALDEAIEHLNAAHATRPDDVAVIQHLLIDLDATGRKNEAQQLLKLFMASTSVDVRRATGVALLEAGDYPSASVLLESVRRDAPGSEETDLLLARAYIGALEDFSAIDLLKPRETADTSGETGYLLGLAYEAAGATEEAAAAFETAVRLNPRNAFAQYHLGVLDSTDPDRLSPALTHLRAAVALDAANPAYALALARALLEQNDAREARDVLERVRAHGPEAGERDLLMGIAEIATRGPGSASPILERAVAENPALALSDNILGFCYLSQGEMAKAAAAYAKASDLKPASRLFAHSTAVAFDRSNDPQRALLYAERAAALPDANGDDHYLLGKLLSKAGRFKDAIRELNQAVAFNPDSGESYFLLARCYMQSGESEQANAWVAKLKALQRRRDSASTVATPNTATLTSSSLLQGAPAAEAAPPVH